MGPEEKRLWTLARVSHAHTGPETGGVSWETLGLSTGVLGYRAQPLERAADQSRYVHLGDADALGDLGLREVLDEAQVEHDPVAGRQRLQRRRDRRAVLHELEAVVLDADRLRVGLAVPLVAEAVGLERDGVVGRRGLHRLEHLLRGQVRRR